MDRKPQRERRPFPHLTVDAEIPTEELSEPAGDGETEPRSALHRITARTRVHLLELVKYAFLITRGDAHAGVDDLKGNPSATRVRRTTRERRILGRLAAW